MSYSFFSTPFTGATTVSAEEEILEGEEVVISSLSFVNARTPVVLLKVLLENRCFKFLLLSPCTNLNDARDLWWSFLCKMEDVDVDVDEEEKILHLDEEEEDKEDTAVLMEDTDVIVAALMSCVYARASNLKILNSFWISGLTLSLFLSRFFKRTFAVHKRRFVVFFFRLFFSFEDKGL